MCCRTVRWVCVVLGLQCLPVLSIEGVVGAARVAVLEYQFLLAFGVELHLLLGEVVLAEGLRLLLLPSVFLACRASHPIFEVPHARVLQIGSGHILNVGCCLHYLVELVVNFEERHRLGLLNELVCEAQLLLVVEEALLDLAEHRAVLRLLDVAAVVGHAVFAGGRWVVAAFLH